MPEILTESFCERCGTRYTFESAAPRKTKRLGQFKTLSKGMKNWVMSDDTSLDEAMAAARSDEERELTSQQLDAFHSTFNFCMNCRQYTCSNCWNAAEGRCLTCAPHLGHEILPAPFPEQVAAEPVRIEADAWPEIDLSVAAADGNGNGNGHSEPDPWGTPANELGIEEIDPAARLAFLAGDAAAPAAPSEPAWPADTIADPVAEAPAADVPAAPADPAPAASTAPTPGGWSDTFFRDARATEPIPATPAPAAPTPEPEPEPQAAAPSAGSDPEMVVADPIAADVAAAAPEPPVAESLPPSVEGRAVAGASRTSDLLRRFRPGQSLDAELAAFEAELERNEAAPALEPEPVAEAEAATAAAPAPEPEPVIAEAAPEPVVVEPEPAVAEVANEPIAAEPAVEPEAVVAAEPEAVADAPILEPVADDVLPVAAAPEPMAAAPEPEPVAPAAPEPEPVAAAPEPEPVAAASEPEPVAAAAEPTPEPVREDRIEQPTWRIFAPDGNQPTPVAPPPPAPTLPTPPPNGNGAPQWPVRPDQPESPAMALLANRGNGGANAGLWAASTREVLAQPGGAPRAGAATGVQPCTNCGLSLSATARFCRRCGTRQA